MKILLVAVNARYTHMNPALYSIRAYSMVQAFPKNPCFEDADLISDSPAEMEIAEYTINQYPRDVLRDIYRRQPDIIGFSCYIWNIAFIGELLGDIKKVLPCVRVILGGPEVSYNPEDVLSRYPAVDNIITGEGEKAWSEITDHAERIIAGVPIPLDEIPFMYDNLDAFANRMLYYETSRGCPFGCSYCLSSESRGVRFRSLKLVLPELQKFLDAKAMIVKFVDRTFNAKKEHAEAIWKYLKEHDNGVTTFHFEIEADLITDEQIEFLRTVRKGLFQFEIGVQSTNGPTLREVNRRAELFRIKHVVESLKDYMKVHVDLIAGLPFEDLEAFKKSFNEVYSWGTDELQLGFLKVLHGTQMERKASEYGMKWQQAPPYEVLSNNWLSYADISELKKIEEQLETFGNNEGFRHTMKKLLESYGTPWDMFADIAAHRSEGAISKAEKYELLRSMTGSDVLDEAMIHDLEGKEALRYWPKALRGKLQ